MKETAANRAIRLPAEALYVFKRSDSRVGKGLFNGSVICILFLNGRRMRWYYSHCMVCILILLQREQKKESRLIVLQDLLETWKASHFYIKNIPLNLLMRRDTIAGSTKRFSLRHVRIATESVNCEERNCASDRLLTGSHVRL